MNTQSDQELLRLYVESRSESAFAELVRRHVDLVYSAALRMVGDSHVAKDVTQDVFVALARNAPSLATHPVLTGWLHRAAQNLAANHVRTRVRRQAREQEAVVMNESLAAESEVSWANLAPHLDAALGALNEADRDAVLLRYFEKKSAAEMAQILGVGEDAAQKRVSRAVEKLREFFLKRKITVGAGGLAVLLSANAVQAAPIGLAATISAAAFAGTAVSTSTIIAATTKAIAMTTFQKIAVTAALTAAIGAGIYQAKQAHAARAEAQALRQQQAPLAGQIQQLQNNFADATNRLADLLAENSRLKSNQTELLKLRGEVTRLRNGLAAVTQQQADSKSKDNLPEATNAYIATAPLSKRINRLQAHLRQHPEAGIPELQFADPVRWLNSIQSPVENDEQLNNALSLLRRQAMSGFMSDIRIAEQEFENANDGRFPGTLMQLLPYLDSAKGQVMLDNYEIAPAKTITDPNAHITGDWVILRKVRVNPNSNSPMERLAAFAGGQSAWYVSDARD